MNAMVNVCPSPPPGMKIDIDVLQPTIQTVKLNWQQLPEPVREVAPFIGGAPSIW